MQSTYLEGCKFERENQRLLEREKMCETMDKAEKLALIRALRGEIALVVFDSLRYSGGSVSQT